VKLEDWQRLIMYYPTHHVDGSKQMYWFESIRINPPAFGLGLSIACVHVMSEFSAVVKHATVKRLICPFNLFERSGELAVLSKLYMPKRLGRVWSGQKFAIHTSHIAIRQQS
jgi:hypothetical protein